MSGYVERLNAAWLDHLAPRALDAPTVISTFAGCGGSSLGYSMAGFRELLAVEWDQNAVDTFRLNFPEVPVYHGDIAQLSVAECLSMTGLQPGDLDVFDGSPPCQGFSTAGKRQIDDPRNGLFREYVRLLRGLQPKAFVMENVSGMVKGKMKLVFVEILRELKASGYRVSARLLNAMYFHVPQSRQRMIFIGVREDLDIEPSHPVAMSSPVTVQDAWIGGVPICSIEMPPVTGKTFEALVKCKPGQSIADVLGRSFSARRVSMDENAPTIIKTLPFHRYPGMFHPFENRGITIAEVKRLASFPDQFQMAGKYGEAWARIGNSVPPLFMRAIAEHIRAHILTPALIEAGT